LMWPFRLVAAMPGCLYPRGIGRVTTLKLAEYHRTGSSHVLVLSGLAHDPALQPERDVAN
jgi:hypothetical protein